MLRFGKLSMSSEMALNDKLEWTGIGGVSVFNVNVIDSDHP